MQIFELVVRNSLGCEIARVDVGDASDGINLISRSFTRSGIADALRDLQVGDTLSIEERWTESN